MFLTLDELTQLTGYERKGDQRKVLGRMGIRFVVNAKGVPIVSRAAVEEQLGGRSSGPALPDFEALAEVTSHGPQKKA